MFVLRLPPGNLASLELRARTASPLESCGVLLGTMQGGSIVAAQWLPLNNTDRRPDRFSIPDSELRRARRIAAAEKMDVVAILHSHPLSEAQLSRLDREGLLVSKVPWVIIAFAPEGGLQIEAFGAGDGMPIPVLIDNS